MEKYNISNLCYGVVDKWSNDIKETYKTILLKLNNRFYYDFRYKLILEENNNLNTKENKVYHLKRISLDNKEVSKRKIMKKIKTI